MKVQLEYFKANGNYYAVGEYETSCKRMKAVVQEVKHKVVKRSLPGLIRSHTNLIIRICVTDISYPVIIPPF